MLKILLLLTLIHSIPVLSRLSDSSRASVLSLQRLDTVKPAALSGIKTNHGLTFRIKEIARARHQPKPAKVGEVINKKDSITFIRPPRVRRPSGLDRPPEIPRVNGN